MSTPNGPSQPYPSSASSTHPLIPQLPPHRTHHISLGISPHTISLSLHVHLPNHRLIRLFHLITTYAIWLSLSATTSPSQAQSQPSAPAVSSSTVPNSQPITLEDVHLHENRPLRKATASMPQSLAWSSHHHWLVYTTSDPSSNITIHCLNPHLPHLQKSFSHADFQKIAAASDLQISSRVGDNSPAPPAADTSSTNHLPNAPKPTLTWLSQTNLLRVRWNQTELDYIPDQARWIVPQAQLRKDSSTTKPPKEASEWELSPDKSWSIFILKNDLYALRLATDRRPSKTVRITQDGSSTRLNGLYSWVYWEEIMNRATWKAYQWSPRSDRIAFLQSDEASVGVQPIIDFSSTQPSTHKQRYPKAGTTNPTVRLGLWETSRKSVRWISWPQGSWEYIARFQWAPDGNTLLVQTLNRAQNHLTLWSIDSGTLRQRRVLEEKSSTWVDLFGDPLFLEGRNEFVWVSERSGFRHLYLYKMDGTLVRTLTSGNWDVGDAFSTAGIQYHPNQDTITFPAGKESPVERHHYSISRLGGTPALLTFGKGTHRLQFSKDGQYAVDQWSGTTSLPSCDVIPIGGSTPPISLGKVTPTDYAPYRWHRPELRTFTGSSGDTFYFRITLPQGFKSGIKYPLIAYVYGEPAGQLVRDSSPEPLESVLAEHGFIAAALDARGTPGRGRAWLESIQKDQATRPLEDWSEWVQHLGSLGFVDTNRLGVWGWSGGGTMTCQLMFQRPGLFKAGAAVAAVTDKTLYDTIYTERYLGLPRENPEGYRKSSPLSFAASLQGKLLIAHGISDDNVHVQNVYQLLTALTMAGKPYELYLYPQKDHGIGGKEHRYHLFQRILEFFEKHLQPGP